MNEGAEAPRGGQLAALRRQGRLTPQDVIQSSSRSSVHPEDATRLAREAGIDVDEGGQEDWTELRTLADEGAGAFTVVEESPVTAEDLEPESAAAIYLREIGRTPLLTAEEEVALARQREAGVAARARLTSGTAPAAEHAALEATVQAGDAARKRLIESNLRLVVSVARRYLGRGLAFLDLVQEGNLGLQRAVDKYEWRRGFRFSTYAYWWIRQSVSRALTDQGRTIRLPVHMVEQVSRVYSTALALQQELEREPTDGEIAARLGIEPQRVGEVRRAASTPISIETPIAEANEGKVADLIADAAVTAPAEAAEARVLADSLDLALHEYLTPREARVLRLRFGLAGTMPHTLGEIAEELGVSRERARQIEGEALRKLRAVGKFREQFGAFVE